MTLSKHTQAHLTIPSQTLHALENSVQGPSVCSRFLNAYTCVKTDCLEHMLEKYGAECSREWIYICQNQESGIVVHTVLQRTLFRLWSPEIPLKDSSVVPWFLYRLGQ